MTIEQARIHMIPKPWGRTDLRPWNVYHDTRTAIGEITLERADTASPPPALALTLVFTSAQLSAQAHADAAFARSIDLASSTCAAWYILAASANGRIAVGLKKHIDDTQIRASLRNDSIAARMRWHAVQTGSSNFIPQGTLHAVGAGLAVIEIRRNCTAVPPRSEQPDDGTLSLPARRSRQQTFPQKLSSERTVLIANAAFVLERLTLAPGVVRELDACVETWLFVLAGSGRVNSVDATIGQTFFLATDRACIRIGPQGLQCLVAYAHSVPTSYLLQRVNSMRVPDPPQRSPVTVQQLLALPARLAAPSGGALPTSRDNLR